MKRQTTLHLARQYKKYLSKDIMNLRLDARDGAGWIIATVDVAKGRFRRHKVTSYI